LVCLFALPEPIDLQLLFGPWRTRKLYLRSLFVVVAVTIQSDNWPRSIVDLLFVTMCCALDLAPLITLFHCCEHPTQPLDFTKLAEDRHFHCALHRFHSGGAA